LTAFSRDVLISLVKDKKEADRAPLVVGPSRAQKHLRSSTSAAASSSAPLVTGDPWMAPGHDPWQSWHGTAQSAPDKAAKRYEVLGDQLKSELNTSLKESLDARLQDGQHGASMASAFANWRLTWKISIFFSSGLADVALRLGPVIGISR
jgi:hypothetical protein